MLLSNCRFLVFIVALAFFSCAEKEKEKVGSEKKDTSVQQIMPVNKDSAASNTSNSVYAEVDISPMDMSYFPPKYPQQKMAGLITKPPVMRVIYSRPHLQGRKLFEEVIKYGQMWRLGANEATELDLFQPVNIGEKKIAPGRYTMYAIPKAGYWTIALNTDVDMWGLKQEPRMDEVRVQVPVTYYNPEVEYFTMVFQQTNYGADLVISWADVEAKLPVKF